MATYQYDYIDNTNTAAGATASTGGGIVLGIDFNTGLALMSNADLKQVSGAESLLQRVIKYLRTERNFYEIYAPVNNADGESYGVSIYEAIGYVYPAVALSKYSLEIKEYLAGEYDVESVDSVKLTPVDDKLLIEINLTSIYDTIEIKEVIENKFNLYGQGA